MKRHLIDSHTGEIIDLTPLLHTPSAPKRRQTYPKRRRTYAEAKQAELDIKILVALALLVVGLLAV